MKKYYYLIFIIGMFFYSCVKRDDGIIPYGTYDWVSSNIKGKIITPDSLGKSYKFIVDDKIRFYENDKLLFKGNFYYSELDNNVQGCSYGTFPEKFLVGNSRFTYYSCNDDHYLIGFPLNIILQDGNEELNILGENKFTKR